MTTSRRQPERSGKGAASAEKPLTKAAAAEAMDKFKNLTRQILNVPRDKIEAEQRRHVAKHK